MYNSCVPQKSSRAKVHNRMSRQVKACVGILISAFLSCTRVTAEEAALDTDQDGLPDSWEQARGLNPSLSFGLDGAGGDPDLDGITNQTEFQVGLNPRVGEETGRPRVHGTILCAVGPSDASVPRHYWEQHSIPSLPHASDEYRDLVISNRFVELSKSNFRLAPWRWMWSGYFRAHASAPVEFRLTSPGSCRFYVEGNILLQTEQEGVYYSKLIADPDREFSFVLEYVEDLDDASVTNGTMPRVSLEWRQLQNPELLSWKPLNSPESTVAHDSPATDTLVLKIETPGWVTASPAMLDSERRLVADQPPPPTGGIFLCRAGQPSQNPRYYGSYAIFGDPALADYNNAKMVFVELFRTGAVWRLQCRTDGTSHATEWGYGHDAAWNFAPAGLPRLRANQTQVQEWIGLGDASDAPPGIFYSSQGKAYLLSGPAGIQPVQTMTSATDTIAGSENPLLAPATLQDIGGEPSFCLERGYLSGSNTFYMARDQFTLNSAGIISQDSFDNENSRDSYEICHARVEDCRLSLSAVTRYGSILDYTVYRVDDSSGTTNRTVFYHKTVPYSALQYTRVFPFRSRHRLNSLPPPPSYGGVDLMGYPQYWLYEGNTASLRAMPFAFHFQYTKKSGVAGTNPEGWSASFAQGLTRWMNAGAELSWGLDSLESCEEVQSGITPHFVWSGKTGDNYSSHSRYLADTVATNMYAVGAETVVLTSSYTNFETHYKNVQVRAIPPEFKGASAPTAHPPPNMELPSCLQSGIFTSLSGSRLAMLESTRNVTFSAWIPAARENALAGYRLEIATDPTFSLLHHVVDLPVEWAEIDWPTWRLSANRRSPEMAYGNGPALGPDTPYYYRVKFYYDTNFLGDTIGPWSQEFAAFRIVDSDPDHDSLPDWWEAAYLGTTQYEPETLLAGGTSRLVDLWRNFMVPRLAASSGSPWYEPHRRHFALVGFSDPDIHRARLGWTNELRDRRLILNQGPEWWTWTALFDRNQPPEARTNDFAAANLGQLANFAHKALSVMRLSYEEEGGPGRELRGSVDWLFALPLAEYSRVATVADVLRAGRPFYTRLAELENPAPPPPWIDGLTPLNTKTSSAANIGQLKRVFSFHLRPPPVGDSSLDADADGIPDHLEVVWGTVHGEDDLQERDLDSRLDSDGDGVPNGHEVQHGYNPHDPASVPPVVAFPLAVIVATPGQTLATHPNASQWEWDPEWTPRVSIRTANLPGFPVHGVITAEEIDTVSWYPAQPPITSLGSPIELGLPIVDIPFTNELPTQVSGRSKSYRLTLQPVEPHVYVSRPRCLLVFKQMANPVERCSNDSDQDDDGLTDCEEQLLGTNLEQHDTLSSPDPFSLHILVSP